MKHPKAPPDGLPSWLGIAGLLADLAFETDRDGRFSAFGPGSVLGFQQSQMLGIHAAVIFTSPQTAFHHIFARICAERQLWQGKTMLRRADGGQSLYRLALAPLVNQAGMVTGAAGLVFDLNAPELNTQTMNETAAFAEIPVTALLCPETGLWAFESFTEQAARRFDRLDVENQPGTLVLLGFSRVRPVLHKPTAILLADELRDIVRPTDMLGRLAATTIAIWCDGMDHLTGAERAARLCLRLPAALPGETIISAGLSTRWPGSEETPLDIIQQASAALQAADDASKDQDVGTYRLWQKNNAA